MSSRGLLGKVSRRTGLDPVPRSVVEAVGCRWAVSGKTMVPTEDAERKEIAMVATEESPRIPAWRGRDRGIMRAQCATGVPASIGRKVCSPAARK